ncbi:uncharacterized protein LOC18429163 isoform X1 [Amborella trichopoda]|uniref:Response regulatory domain-containing protein n=1 Tax=Amborella trichopoda TaxID=13333 RepID=W1NTZ9_AMBTC|nr:uncharacterized protein LOC18429163 isoform X1 [Amborella trichopoda]ERN01087.1 hypothetical protein AMTR_s00002p00186590 [Amborella trichopoda]|eukprot:XP_020519848.1 uncharacterized protein LOC18429163 isoform X1 [Amborella trichopoda]
MAKTLIEELGYPSSFPEGLRVLVVDDDHACLKVMEELLQSCKYEVVTCSEATGALNKIRDGNGRFDVVLCNVHLPDMDGLELLNQVRMEMDLPFIMISVDSEKDIVMKGIENGACDFLIKPVRKGQLKTIWQHVIRNKITKKNNGSKEVVKIMSTEDCGGHHGLLNGLENVHSRNVEDSLGHHEASNGLLHATSLNKGNDKKGNKRKDKGKEENDSRCTSASCTPKKPRIVWTSELHQIFLDAINKLAHNHEEVIPTKIEELMNVPGLCKGSIASHLQKYRKNLRTEIKDEAPQGDSAPIYVGNLPKERHGSVIAETPDLDAQVFASQMNPMASERRVVNRKGHTNTSTNMVSRLPASLGVSMGKEQLMTGSLISPSMAPVHTISNFLNMASLEPCDIQSMLPYYKAGGFLQSCNTVRRYHLGNARDNDIALRSSHSGFGYFDKHSQFHMQNLKIQDISPDMRACTSGAQSCSMGTGENSPLKNLGQVTTEMVSTNELVQENDLKVLYMAPFQNNIVFEGSSEAASVDMLDAALNNEGGSNS